MSGRWMLAHNGRSHWFEQETYGLSACGCMAKERCYPDATQEQLQSWPCATCSRMATMTRAETVKQRDQRIGTAIMREVALLPKNTGANTDMADRLRKIAEELLGRKS